VAGDAPAHDDRSHGRAEIDVGGGRQGEAGRVS
jgi:hypothetical protein